MRLYFLRHGVAEDHSPEKEDAARRLTAEGIKKLERAVRCFAEYEVSPVVIYTSPLERALQTAQIMNAHLPSRMEITPLLAPGFNEKSLQQLLGHHMDEDVMLVGHEPDFSQTISKVIGGGNVTMKKGGLARVDVLTKVPLQGTLLWLLAPQVLK